MSTVDCVLFDAYGTLFDVHAASRRLIDRLGEGGLAVSETWRQRQVEYTWLRASMNRYAPFWEVTEQALDFALASHRIEDVELRADLLAAYRHPDLFTDVKDALARIRAQGARAAIFSNADPAMLQDALQAAEVADRFDVVVSVDEVKAYKPLPRTYAHALQRCGVTPSHALFVTSNGWDAAGAASAGLVVAWCNRAGAPRERLPAEPAHEVGSLRQIPALLSL